MIADVPESSKHEKLHCLMYMYHTICLFFMTHCAYGILQEEEEEEEEDEEEGREEQKAASQTAGSEAPVGDSVML